MEDIGLRVTRIRTFDQRPLYVPNSTFSSVALENPSRMTNRRIYETIGIRYSDAHRMSDIVVAVREMLVAHEDIAQDRTLIVNFNHMGASALRVFRLRLHQNHELGRVSRDQGRCAFEDFGDR